MDTPAATELIADCEALLSGLLAEHLARHQRDIPAWVWLNLLAHGTEEQLAGADQALAKHLGLRRWREARAYLAREVLATARATTTSLRELQRQVLIPLELQVIGTESSDPHTRPALVSLVLTALAAHRHVARNHAGTKDPG